MRRCSSKTKYCISTFFCFIPFLTFVITMVKQCSENIFFQFHSYSLSNISYTNHDNLQLTSTNINSELILKMTHVTVISSDEIWYSEFEWMKLNCVKVTILIWFLPSAVTVWPFSFSSVVLKFSYHLSPSQIGVTNQSYTVGY